MTDEQMWKAIQHKLTEADEPFFFGLKTTKCFCHPGCTASIPVRSHTVFFGTAQQAVQDGFHPCPHCRPDLEGAARQATELDRICAELEKEETWRKPLAKTAKLLGFTISELTRRFRQQTGLTPAAYMDARRLKAAKDYLGLTTEPVPDVAERLGFAGASAFQVFFQAQAGLSAEAFRRGEGQIRFPSSPVAGFALADTAIGRLVIMENGSQITGVRFVDMMPDELLRRLEGRRSALIAQALGELAEYFSGTRRAFSLPLHLEGTPFQQRIWELLLQIPYGETRTYAQLAAQAGNPGASRAVGAASNRNPMLLLVPCHRVVGSNGTLVGYAGGVDIKEKLLRLERIHATQES